MVTARENRAELLLEPVGERAPGPAPGWMTCQVQVEAVHAVDDGPNLLDEAAGRTLSALLPPNAVRLLPEQGAWWVRGELVRPGVIRVSDDPDLLTVVRR